MTREMLDTVAERWQQAICVDSVPDWCALSDLIATVWNCVEANTPCTQMGEDLWMLAGLAHQRARMLLLKEAA